MKPPDANTRGIHEVVARIPRGRVASYGQVAALAGLPRRARLVGRVLGALPDGSDIPWHRVVNAAGKISLRRNALGYEDLQRELLRREGVRWTGAAISLEKFGWRPRSGKLRPKKVQIA